jgi:hypothetical protein
MKGCDPETLQSAAPKVYDWPVVNVTTLYACIILLYGTTAHFFAFKVAKTAGDIGVRGLA